MERQTFKAWLWTDGRFLPCTGLPLSDRGVRYGMSVFETIRVQGGRPLFFQEHLLRLRLACERAQFRLEPMALASIAPLLTEDGMSRIYVTAGDGAVCAARDGCRVFVFAEPDRTDRSDPTDPSDRPGYRLALSDTLYHPMFGGLKTANYWANLEALATARARGFNEALLFNAEWHLVSACMGNVFVVIDGRLITPPTSTGARDGVVREWVMRQRPVVESPLTRDDLSRATELFLTSSGIGVMPVASVEDRRLPDRLTANALAELYPR